MTAWRRSWLAAAAGDDCVSYQRQQVAWAAVAAEGLALAEQFDRVEAQLAGSSGRR